MKWPFSKKKPDLPRNERGQFAVPATAPATSTTGYTPVKNAENEAKVIDTSLSTLDTGLKFIDGLDNIVKKRIESMMPTEEEAGIEAIPSEWSPVIKTAIEILGPAIQPYVGGLIEKYLHVQPQNTIPQPPSPAAPTPPEEQGKPQGFDAKILIEGAAKTPVIALKAGMPEILSRIEASGIPAETFKKAIKNMSKAI